MDTNLGNGDNEFSPLPDSEMESLMRRVAERLTPSVDAQQARRFAQRCVDEVRRRRRRRSLQVAGALAASVLAVAFLAWFIPNWGPPPIAEAGVPVEAPPFRPKRSLNESVGSGQKDIPPPADMGKPRDSDLYLPLPPVPQDSWVAAIELNGTNPTLRTKTDASCPKVTANAATTLDIPFSQNDRSARVLVLWSKRPCGATLESALQSRSIASFSPGAEDRLIREVAATLEGHRNALLYYRFVPLVAEDEDKESDR